MRCLLHPAPSHNAHAIIFHLQCLSSRLLEVPFGEWLGSRVRVRHLSGVAAHRLLVRPVLGGREGLNALTPTLNDGSRSSYAACPTSQEINDLGPCDSSSSLASTDTPATGSTPARRTGGGRQDGRRIDGGAAARPAKTVRQSRTNNPSPFSPVDLGADDRYPFVNGWVG